MNQKLPHLGSSVAELLVEAATVRHRQPPLFFRWVIRHEELDLRLRPTAPLRSAAHCRCEDFGVCSAKKERIIIKFIIPSQLFCVFESFTFGQDDLFI